MMTKLMSSTKPTHSTWCVSPSFRAKAVELSAYEKHRRQSMMTQAARKKRPGEDASASRLSA